jgi:hypothetical protein
MHVVSIRENRVRKVAPVSNTQSDGLIRTPSGDVEK